MEAADDAWTTAAASSQRASAASVSAVSSTPSQCRGGCSGRQHGPRSSGQTRTIQLCHFHIKFGDAAKKCNPSCSRWANQDRPRDWPARVFQEEEALNGGDADIRSEN